ncbi:hypothetical protein C9374_012252 [Naegleria lovaniensis]|uniref:Uncharacterized protein n=1 Tax=Naegleria lovaniensis TaxID=51637 RepID=A0AA88KEN5_NAELO|nr:uncharacterized protein C9374_012252 [Naegleria lovaniensis]KAG2373386.1 hypothetical protein C9374_012252 [Naegleria lovaniensis]
MLLQQSKITMMESFFQKATWSFGGRSRRKLMKKKRLRFGYNSSSSLELNSFVNHEFGKANFHSLSIYCSESLPTSASSLNQKSNEKEQRSDEKEQNSGQSSQSNEQHEEDWRDFGLFSARRCLNMFGLSGFIYLSMAAFFHFKRKSVKNNEMMKVLVDQDSNMDQLLAIENEAKLLNLLKQVLFLIKSYQYIEEFFHPFFIQRIFDIAISKNQPLNQVALDILANVLREQTSPRLSEEFFNISTQQPQYNMIQLMLNSVLRDNDSATIEAVNAYFNNVKSEHTLSDQQKKSLDVLINLFSNKHLLWRMNAETNDEKSVYREKLLDMVKNGTAQEFEIALKCILQIFKRINREDLSGKIAVDHVLGVYRFLSQLYDTDVVKVHEFWDQTDIFNKAYDTKPKTKDENQKLLDKIEDSHSVMTSLLLSSAFTYAMLERSPQVVLNRIMLAKTVFRSVVLFGFTMYLEKYRESYQEQLEKNHNGMQTMNLSDYLEIWNSAQIRYIYKDMLVLSVVYGFLGFWSLLPMLTSFEK